MGVSRRSDCGPGSGGVAPALLVWGEVLLIPRANLGAVPPEQQLSPGPAAVDSARRLFHVALLFIIFPVIGVPLLWGLLLRYRAGSQRSIWSRLLLSLAILDTVALAGLILSMSLGGSSGEGASEGGWLGVVFDAEQNHELVVTTTVPGSPAETAGLMTGGRAPKHRRKFARDDR